VNPGADRLALEQTLVAGCVALGLDVSVAQRHVLLDYLALLSKWNRAYNLTAVQESEAMVVLHVLDSLTVAPYLDGQRCLDVGSGAGLPGLVLAVLDPSRIWVLLDSNGKKTRFLTQACLELRLRNIEVVQARAEDYQPAERFDVIVSRAVTDLWSLLRATRHLLKPGAGLLAMKGTNPAAEIAHCSAADIVCKVHRVTVCGIWCRRVGVIATNRRWKNRRAGCDGRLIVPRFGTNCRSTAIETR
jgi:16S rRNA (guanine527-N7)-methyltransferase